MNKIILIAIIVVLGPYFHYLNSYQEKASQQITQIRRIYENPEILLQDNPSSAIK